MRTKNFPERRLRRQLNAKWRRGEHLTPEDFALLQRPKDICIRVGAARRAS